MAIVGYARVSTKGQSLEAQIKALTESGVDSECMYTEKGSGAKGDRPEMAAMLKFVRKGDVLVCTKLDRIARSTKHLLEIVDVLEEKGVTFKVLNINLDTSTPTGKLMLTMLGAIAQFEREMMLERQAEGFAIAKAKGRIKGRPSTAQAKAAEIVRLADSGMTKQGIADELGIGVASVYRILKEKGGLMQEVKVIEKLVSYLSQFEDEPVVARTVDGYLPIYADYVDDFWDVVAEGFSNCNYAKENDVGELARRFVDSQFIAQASLHQCRDLLTYALRAERFCDGFWRGCVERGHLQVLLKRLDVIKGELERDG